MGVPHGFFQLRRAQECQEFAYFVLISSIFDICYTKKYVSFLILFFRNWWIKMTLEL